MLVNRSFGPCMDYCPAVKLASLCEQGFSTSSSRSSRNSSKSSSSRKVDSINLMSVYMEVCNMSINILEVGPRYGFGLQVPCLMHVCRMQWCLHVWCNRLLVTPRRKRDTGPKAVFTDKDYILLPPRQPRKQARKLGRCDSNLQSENISHSLTDRQG